MLFYPGAEVATYNVNKFRQKQSKKEWKYIVRAIENASKQGYTGIRWGAYINSENLSLLKEYGYKVIKVTSYIYEINW